VVYLDDDGGVRGLLIIEEPRSDPRSK